LNVIFTEKDAYQINQVASGDIQLLDVYSSTVTCVLRNTSHALVLTVVTKKLRISKQEKLLIRMPQVQLIMFCRVKRAQSGIAVQPVSLTQRIIWANHLTTKTGVYFVIILNYFRNILNLLK